VSKRLRYIDAQWRWMQRFFIVWPFWCALIIGLNIWDDASHARPFNWHNLALGLGIMAWGGVVYAFARLIVRFVRGIYANEGDRS
jgi:hypothetical protein